MAGVASAPKPSPQSLKTLGGIPEVEVAATRSVQNIRNKFPDDPIPTNGRIDGVAKIVDGRINIDKSISTNREIDFVIDKAGNLILGEKHQFLSNGKSVQAAGTMKVANGKVRKITNLSGHFRPTVEESRKFPEILRKMGLDLKNTHLELWEYKLNSDGLISGKTKAVNIYLKN